MSSAWHGFQSPLAEGIRDFLDSRRALGRSFLTEEYALRLLDAFLVRQNVRFIGDIDAKVIESFLASRPRNTPRSYNNLVSAVARLFAWLVERSYLTDFPLRMQTRREVSKRLPFLFGPDLARKLLASAENLKDTKIAPLRGPTYRTIFALLYGLGLRVGEVTRLRLIDLDLDRSLLLIRQTKFAKSRLIPFGPRMRDLLEEYLRLRSNRWPCLPEGLLFSFSGGPINRGTVRRTFRSLIEQMGLEVPEGTSRPRLHDLRHSFAVGTLLRWYRAGVDPGTRLFYLSTFLGHVSPDSTAVYLTITPDLLAEANRRFASYAASAIQEVRHER